MQGGPDVSPWAAGNLHAPRGCASHEAFLSRVKSPQNNFFTAFPGALDDASIVSSFARMSVGSASRTSFSVDIFAIFAIFRNYT